jgi:DNA-binding transcriptional LysR family regulator
VWRFAGAEGLTSMKVKGWINGDSSNVLLNSVVSGYGIALQPIYMLREFLQDGRVVPIMQDYTVEDLETHIVYPTKKNVPRRVSLFIDFLKQHAKQLRDELETPRSVSAPSRD